MLSLGYESIFSLNSIIEKLLATKSQIHKVTQMKFVPLSDEEERIGKSIINCAFKVHKELGHGLLEKVYEIA